MAKKSKKHTPQRAAPAKPVNKGFAIGALAAAVALCAFALWYVFAGDYVSPNKFDCYIYDSQDMKVNSYYDEEDKQWYLFVPSTVDLADMVMYYDAEVTVSSTNHGKLNTQHETLVNAFDESGDSVMLRTSTRDKIKITVLQSNLPAVHVYLNNTTLADVHADKDTKHKNNSIAIGDPGGIYNLQVNGSVEIKGRGNTTWKLYDKKPYQIKFDEKTSILGMDASKKWVLLANSSDDSMLRTSLTYDMAKQLGMEFVPSLEYVDLWIDSEYLGTYLIGDKIELGKSRLNLQDDYGVLFEQDEEYYQEEDNWFYSSTLQRHFVLKEIVTEEDAYMKKATTAFEIAVDKLVNYLYSTDPAQVTLDKLSTMIDVDSFAKYYLISEYVLNHEAMASSFYWYMDGLTDVIHLGPIWDYDTCMGNDGGLAEASGADEHELFRHLLAIPAFNERVQQLYSQHKTVFDSMAGNAGFIKVKIEDSATMNYIRWNVLGQPTGKKDSVDFAPTYDKAVENVVTWLNARKAAFVIASPTVVTTTQNGSKFTATYQNNTCQSVKFAVFNTADPALTLWYTATNSSGTWSADIDLTAYNLSGLYRVDAYVDDADTAAANGWCHTVKAYASPYKLQTAVEGNTLLITLADSGKCSAVSFAVWSDADAQDDLAWYTAVKKSGKWQVSVDLTAHPGSTWCVHAFGNTGSGDQMLAAANAAN